MNKRGDSHRAGPVEHAPGPIMEEEVMFDLAAMLREQGVWADGCSLMTCGATTGHFVHPIAYCDSPETAQALAAAMAASPQPQAGD